VPFLKKAAEPVIVNISSRRGSIQGTLEGELASIYAYNIDKAAQNMLSACLSEDMRQYGIKVFAVHPGRLKTDVAPVDADVEPYAAAEKLADWVEQVDDKTPVGLHDLINGGLIEW
jgi:NAD(P)-dependent dehydrogenase (short-subunit alcohol dehydrogenase family)